MSPRMVRPLPGLDRDKNRARDLIAGMLACKPEQIAFMRNTSDGFASVAAGIDWAEGDNIVSFRNEFPANFYPWRNVRDRFGVELRLCPERDGRIDLDEFIGLIDANTKLVAISAVQYASGFKADLERIGRAAREVDALFAVDIIQGFGADEVRYAGTVCRYRFGGEPQVAVCSPEGCGILYLSDRARERIEPDIRRLDQRRNALGFRGPRATIQTERRSPGKAEQVRPRSFTASSKA